MTATRFILSILLVTPAAAFAQEPTVLKHDGWVAAVAFAPDGKTLASAGADNVVRLWEVGTWKPKGVLKGHTDCVCAVAFSSCGNLVATGSYDRTAKVWSLEHLQLERTFQGHKGVVSAVYVNSFLGSPTVLTASVDGTLRLWPTSFADFVKIDFPMHKTWVNSLAIQRGAVASGSSDGTVGLLTTDEKDPPSAPIFLDAGAGEVRCVAFSPDGKLLAAGNRYHTVRVWDVASKKEIKTLTGHMGDVWSIAFSPDGKTLAAVDTDWKKPSKIKLYDTNTWKERGSLPTPGEILSIAYSPKGDWLAAGCWDKTVRVFPIAIDKK